MTVDVQEPAPGPSGHGQPSPELLARAERGLMRFLIHWPQPSDGICGVGTAEGPSDE
ncbi:hypothetical protein GCM10010302_12630 [Streptomyces polychromogenes]|uniref:Uncharacterized protein n=1 Tax=Streptomyces polychromogenes TaxID=67342 RepID=A0ABN0V5J0_9ACTN